MHEPLPHRLPSHPNCAADCMACIHLARAVASPQQPYCFLTLALGKQGSADADLAYARLEALCAAVKGELQQDLHIHDAAVLPNFVNLPQVTAAEYGRVCAIPCQAAIHQLVLCLCIGDPVLDPQDSGGTNRVSQFDACGL